MIIHQPEIFFQDDEIVISARVEAQNKSIDLPQTLWFNFPAQYQPYLTLRSDGFVTSLMMLSMYLGESLDVRGVVSPRLAYGLEEWQAIFHNWYPRQLQTVRTKFEQLQAMPPDETQGKVAAAFSGGLDSLYTLWRLMPQNQPNPAIRLNYALFIHGFDIPLNQTEKYRRLYQLYQNKLQEVGIELLTARTNIYEFTRLRIKWELMHGGPLIGVALLLGGLLGRFFVNSSEAYKNIKLSHFGTSLLSDHLLSTETIEVVHFGSDQERVGKMVIISDWELAQHVLRVCSNPDISEDIQNCGRCVRCLLNMTRLELLGILPKFKTFPQPFNHFDLLRLAFAVDGFPGADRLVIKAAGSARRWDIFAPMLFIFCLDHIKRFMINQFFERLSPQQRYRIKQRFF